MAGLDIGGTTTSLGVSTGGRFEVVERWRTPTTSAHELLRGTVEHLRGHEPFVAVGIVVPGIVDADAGVVRHSLNLPLTHVALRSELEQRLGVPVAIDNDANGAAFAEAFDDDLQMTEPDLVLLTVGTGVGCGIVLDGRIHRGATGAAGEVAPMFVSADLHADRSSRGGTLEGVASGRVLDELAVAAGQPTGAELTAAARDGSQQARRCFEALAHRLAFGVANIIHLLEPRVVLIGGGVSEAGELMLAPLRSHVSELLLPGCGERTTIRPARYQAQAGARGAVLMARYITAPSYTPKEQQRP